jgi:hypothetical protein
MAKERVKKYIYIKEIGESPSRKTKIFGVINKRENRVSGEIRWYGGFRKYCFYPNSDFLFDSDCLQMIVEYLNTLNNWHKH